MKRPALGGMVLGLFLGVFVGLFAADLVTSLIWPKERVRLVVPVLLCDVTATSCDARGELAAGTVLHVDPKGFAELVIRVEPGAGPTSFEPALDAGQQRLMLQKKAK